MEVEQTFYDLSQKELVSTQEILDTLEQYAYGGSAIIGHMVISLIQRVKLTTADRILLIQYARRGMHLQEVLSRSEAMKQKNAGEYQQVVDYLLSRS